MTTGFTHYRQVVMRRLPVMLLVSFAAAAVAYGITVRTGPTQQVHFSYLVSLNERESASDFRFDGYYALQATDLFAATLARWVQAPEVVVAAFNEAGIPLPTDDPRLLTRYVAAEKTAPQLVQVLVKSDDRELSRQLSAGLQKVMERNIALYHDRGIPAVTFTAVASEPWASSQQPAAGIIAIAVFVAVLLLSVNAVLLFESVKP